MSDIRINTEALVKNKGLKRIAYACTYSAKGLQSAYKNEEAFRQEVIILLPLAMVSILLEMSAVEHVLLLTTLCLVLLTELLNSAIECVVDRVGLEQHTLSGRAKDYGSAAVALSIIIMLLTWGFILWEVIF